MASSSVSIIIPCYNEEGAVTETIERIAAAIEPDSESSIIAVDDGSGDNTGAILDDLAKRLPQVKVFHHDRNRGYGAALKTGIRNSSAELIAIIDADGTYPTDRLPELIARCTTVDMVVGARIGDDVTYPLIRRIPKVFMHRYASWIAGCNIPDMNSGMRVFRRGIALKFLGLLPDTFSFTTTITLCMLTNHYSVEYVPISYSSRVGKSKIHPIKDTLRFCQLLVRTGMYFAPLRVLLPVGLLLFVGFCGTFAYDIFVLRNITQKTLVLLMFSMNTCVLALLADMIDKRMS